MHCDSLLEISIKKTILTLKFVKKKKKKTKSNK